jgi:hypothetical protein
MMFVELYLLHLSAKWQIVTIAPVSALPRLELYFVLIFYLPLIYVIAAEGIACILNS